MTPFRLSAPAWKGLITMLALLSAILLVIEFTRAVKPLADGVHGSLGVTLTDQAATSDGLGKYRLAIESIAPGSALAVAGARVGDQLRFDHYLDRFRQLVPGERVGLTLYQGGQGRALSAVAVAVPISFDDYFIYCGRLLLAVPALLFGLMVAFKQSEGRAYRALSLTFIGLSFSYFFGLNYSPRSASFALSKFLVITSYSLIWYGCVAFVMSYHAYRRTAARAWLQRLFAVYRALACATALYAAGFAIGRETPLLDVAILLCAFGGLALTVAGLIDGWRHSSGEIRQRHLWLLLSFASGTAPAMLTLIRALDADIAGTRITVMLYFLGQFLMYVGLVYAVLRYRVFNFDFAISRAVVFSVVSVVMLCTFGVIEWMYASVMHGGGHKNSLLVDAALALAVYLLLHKIHGKLERGVERVLFEKWHLNEHRLRAYVRRAAHVTTVDALVDSFAAALDRFTGQAGCAIYLRQEDGSYARAAGTLDGGPELVGGNDGAAVALRADLAPIFVDKLATVLRGELLLPMSHRGVLDGFVLVCAKRRRESYRPDEFEALGFAAQQVGLDLHALRVDALQRELRELERKASRQDQELQLMAGRRRSSRSGIEQEATVASE
jgi:nitrate reductase NapE component